MVLAPGDIKAIATEIASKIITELRKPVEKSFIENEPVGMREATYNDKEVPIGPFKDRERRTHKEMEDREGW
jgi:hypothetical protein